MYRLFYFCSFFFLITAASLAQNVGIANNNPQERLDVNGNVRTNGLRILNNGSIDLGVSIPGKETNAGRIGYGLFTANTVDFVGGGTNPGDRRIRFWAEGGALFTGGANFLNTLTVGSQTAHPSAALQLNTTNQGLLINRITTAQRLSIASPANGLMVFDTDLGLFCYFDGLQWQLLQPTTSAATLPPNELPLGTTRCDLSDSFAVFYTSSNIRVFKKMQSNWASYQTIALPPGDPKGICVTNRFIAAASVSADNGTTCNGQLTVYTFNNSTGLFQQSYTQLASSLVSGFGISIDAWDSVRQLTIGPGVTVPDTLLRIAVGATNNNRGAAYLYEKNGNTYSRFNIAAVVSGAGTPSHITEFFGFSVAVHGRLLLIGSPGWSQSGGSVDHGAAYLYRRFTSVGGANTWNLLTTFSNTSTTPQQNAMGYSVAMCAEWAAIGMPGSDVSIPFEGTVTILKYNGVSETYVRDGTIVGPFSDTRMIRFGKKVAVTDDGFLFVSAPHIDIESPEIPGKSITNAGIVFQYDIKPRKAAPPLPTPVSNPTLVRSMKAAVPYASDYFGEACFARNKTVLIVKPTSGLVNEDGQSVSSLFYRY